MADIGIVGYGRVGRAVEYGFKDKHTIHAYDKFPKQGESLESLEEVVKASEFTFVCVPTPYKDGTDGYPVSDLSIMDENLEQIAKLATGTDKIVLIKSTVLPGTIRDYMEKYPGLKLCSNPEFLTEANYLEDFVNSDRHVIGADDANVLLRVTQLYRDRFPKTPIVGGNPSEAEMTKLFSNCLLPTKVIVGNIFNEASQALGEVSYEKVKEGVVADSRIGSTHLDVTAEGGFGGKCFPKDLLAMIGLLKRLGLDASLFEAVWENNKRFRDRAHWDWENGKIPWVRS